MTNYLKVQITRETEKAYFVEDGQGRRCWIQKRWLRADSTVNESHLESAARGEKLVEERKAALNASLAVRETEKAIAIAAWFTRIDGEAEKSILLWVPKSMLQGEARLIPIWMLDKKIGEAEDFNRGYRFSYFEGVK